MSETSAATDAPGPLRRRWPMIKKILTYAFFLLVAGLLISLARSLGMQTIAEWAEDAATVETLAEIGVDHVQGFAIARPLPPEKILASPSAAAFIQDEYLAQFVRTLGDPVYAAAQIDMMAMGGGKKDFH